MIRHVWSVLCLKSVIDKDTNNITLVDVLEQLNVVISPVPSPQGRAVLPVEYELISFFTREGDNQPCRGAMRITLQGPSGNAIDEPNQFPIDLSASFERSRNRTRMAGIPLVGPGIYNFLVEYQDEMDTGWKTAARLPLQVAINTSQAEGLPSK
jgi:hypothetical protein